MEPENPQVGLHQPWEPSSFSLFIVPSLIETRVAPVIGAPRNEMVFAQWFQYGFRDVPVVNSMRVT
jgi:hypothetical protein